MKNVFILILLLILFNSCATLVNTKYTNISILSNDKPFQIRLNNDSASWHETPYEFKVKRSKSDLLLVAKNDSIQKVINIKSKLSGAFWIGNLWNGTGIIGYGIDLTNDNRFTYPRKITININDTNKTRVRNYSTKLEPEKNLIRFTFSIPEGNSFHVFNGTSYTNSFGFLGLTTGLDYFFSKNKFFSLNAGTLTDFIIPFPAPFDRMGSYKRNFANFVDLEIKKEFKKFNFGFGLQFAKTKFIERETVTLFPNYLDTLKYNKTQNNFGLSFSSYYRISRGFDIGVKYFPSFMNWDNSKTNIDYTHLLFLDLKFNIELFRPKK